jgi:formate hydrogenlyase subunit 6/NADH:ubiquinone oxidoreductase subunit I
MSIVAIATPASRGTLGSIRDYLANIARAVTSTFEGFAVTASWLFRRPLTIQYPDRIDRPVQEMLPEGYRGLLEVDLDRCTGCLLCAKTCPIQCIDITVEKNPETNLREIRSFDVDIGRCMYCGLCTEACKFGALVHTTDFEATAASPADLVLHFVEIAKPVAKIKAGEGPARRPQGTILAEVVPPLLQRKRWPGKGGTP